MPVDMLREIWPGLKRFWGLSWWWKGPILSAVTVVSLGVGLAAAGVGDGEVSRVLVVTPTPTEAPTAAPTPTPAPTPSPSPEPTSTPVPEPTATPTPEPTSRPTPVGTPNVLIDCIFFDGLVYRTESDEYVQITNHGTAAQNTGSWLIRDVSEGFPSLAFPAFQLQPSQTIRVYTNEVHPEWGGFSFGSGKAVWNNEEPDTAALFDAGGDMVSTRSYPPSC